MEASQCQCQWSRCHSWPDGQWEATGRQRVPLGLLVTVARHQAGALVRAAMVAWRKGVQTGSRAQR